MGPRGIRIGSGEGSKMRNFIVCTVHLTVKVIKSIKLRWAGKSKLVKGKICFKILKGKPTGNRTFRILGVENIILQWILNKYVSIREIRLIRLMIGEHL